MCDPAHKARGAELAVGSDKTVAPVWQSLPWGGIKGKAQSERPKRDPRHSCESVESSGQPLGAGNSHQVGQSDGPAPAGKIVEAWGQPQPMAGACHPMPSAQALTNRQDSRNREIGENDLKLRITTLKSLHFSWARIANLTGLTQAQARAAWHEAKAERTAA